MRGQTVDHRADIYALGMIELVQFALAKLNRRTGGPIPVVANNRLAGSVPHLEASRPYGVPLASRTAS
jgi:hypothetical protein